MNQDLSVKLAEKGYDPLNMKKVSLKNFGESIVDYFYKKKTNQSFLFDGHVKLVVRSDKNGKSYDNYRIVSILKKHDLCVERHDEECSLYFYSIGDESKYERSSIYIGIERGECLDKEHSSWKPDEFINFTIKEGSEDKVRIELHSPESTSIYLVNYVGGAASDKLFWQLITKPLEIRLNEIKAQYTDKSPVTPWFTAMDEKTGNELILGTRYRVYAVKTHFKEPLNSNELKELINNVRYSPQTINDSWVGSSFLEENYYEDEITDFEAHFSRGSGLEVKKFLESIMKNNAL